MVAAPFKFSVDRRTVAAPARACRAQPRCQAVPRPGGRAGPGRARDPGRVGPVDPAARGAAAIPLAGPNLSSVVRAAGAGPGLGPGLPGLGLHLDSVWLRVTVGT